MNDNRNNALNNILESNKTKPKVYPVKEFLLKCSYLVKFDKKEQSGRSLTQAKQKRRTKIFEQRDKAFANIRKEFQKYYETATNGDYRYNGKPEIEKGIRGWIEAKIWRLLIAIGEPNHVRYGIEDDDFFWFVEIDKKFWDKFESNFWAEGN